MIIATCTTYCICSNIHIFRVICPSNIGNN
nr:MAG TPA: hypothetical protein [Caudoviricetes sp.]